MILSLWCCRWPMFPQTINAMYQFYENEIGKVFFYSFRLFALFYSKNTMQVTKGAREQCFGITVRLRLKNKTKNKNKRNWWRILLNVYRGHLLVFRYHVIRRSLPAQHQKNTIKKPTNPCAPREFRQKNMSAMVGEMVQNSTMLKQYNYWMWMNFELLNFAPFRQP